MTTRFAFFDLDGTLTDSSPGIVSCMAHALTVVGVPVPPVAVLKAHIGPPLQELFMMLGVPGGHVDAAVVAYRQRYTAGAMFENRVYDGIPAALEELRAQGWSLAVATSKPREFAVPILERLNLAGHFVYVAGATLDGTRRYKADVIRHALDQTGAALEHTVMIGDRPEDLEGASECGLAALAVSWGFGDRSDFGTAPVVDHPSAIPTALQTLQP